MVNIMNTTFFYELTRASRVLACLALSTLTTASLLYLMSGLISNEVAEPPKEAPTAVVDIWMGDDTRKVDEHIDKIEKPEQQEAPPEVKFNETFDPSDVRTDVIKVRPNIKQMKPTFNVSQSSMPIAQLIKQPRYPAGAAMRGTEGWVKVQFDISGQGKTFNIEVLSSEPKGVFESAALAAVKAWKYQPLIDEEGKPQPYYGLQQRIVFKMEQ